MNLLFFFLLFNMQVDHLIPFKVNEERWSRDYII